MFIRTLLITISLLSITTIQAEISDKDLSGLLQIEDSKKVKVYVKPGHDLSQYKSFAVGDITATMDQEWLKRFNRDQKSLADRLNEKDQQEVTARYAKGFKTTLERTLKKDGRFTLSDGGSGVLKVETAIVDLQVYAPDKLTAQSKIQFVRQAGRATLETRMYDANTGELIVAIIDKRKTRDHVDIFQTNRVRNQFEFANVYRYWTKTWLKSLEQRG